MRNRCIILLVVSIGAYILSIVTILNSVDWGITQVCIAIGAISASVLGLLLFDRYYKGF